MPYLSVIIPVYKVEPYLRQCVDSVLNQNLDNMEIILVDDGSPDNCPLICDEYAAQFDWVKVIHQENGGLSAARNTGIRNAAGEYIVFMDSDDWWNSDVDVKSLLQQVKEVRADVYLFSGFDYLEGSGLLDRKDAITHLSGNIYDAETYYKNMLAAGNLQVSAATKILKRTFIEDNQLYFRDKLLGEDNEWMIRVLRSFPSIRLLPEPLYICRLARKDSITNTIHYKNVEDLLRIIELSMQYYDDSESNKTLLKYEYAFCAYLWFCALGLSSGLKHQDKGKIRPWLQKTQEVCNYSVFPKTKLAYALYRTMGYDMTMLILGTYIKLKSFYHLSRNKVQ